MKKLLLVLALLWSTPVWAQNPVCPTRPTGDNTNACASTAFVTTAVAGGASNIVIPGAIGGRLTLISGACVAITDQVAKTVLYYAPCGLGGVLPVYNGTNFISTNFISSPTDQIGPSITLGSSWGININYDLFWNGTALCTLAWSGNARVTAITQLSGINVNATSSAICRTNNTTVVTCAQYQCTLVGYFYTNATGGQVDLKFGTNAVGGGQACICIGNVFNQVQASASVGDTTTTWPYTINAFRQANGSATNQILAFQGLQGPPIEAGVTGYSSNPSANVVQAVGIGIDSTTTNVATSKISNVGAASTNLPSFVSLDGPNAYLSVGLHAVVRLEFSAATGTTTWIGAIPGNELQTSIRGKFWY